MKTTAISATSYQLTRFGLVNCYLVREPDGFTLIDTGVGGAGKQIVAIAATLGAPIRRIVLTHAHGDHVGSVDELASKLALSQATTKQSDPARPGALELAASGRSIPLLRKPPDKTRFPGEPASKVKGSLPGIRTSVTDQLIEGQLYGSLRVIETPGHIPGHLSFIDERDGTLFAGDALITVGRLSVSGYAPWYFPLPNVATWDKPLALASADKLLNCHFERTASGHGPVRAGGTAKVREALDRATTQRA